MEHVPLLTDHLMENLPQIWRDHQGVMLQPSHLRGLPMKYLFLLSLA
jgi:hypothetical protein